jgi:ferric-dicitrate binding protein FerR (iron transport regulator)
MIRSYKDERKDELYVSTGKVAFGSLKNPDDRIILTKGMKSEIEDSRLVASTPIVDVNFDAWKKEKIVFNNTKLDEVSRTLEKYYAVSLQLNTPEILNCRFTGTFEKSGINEILKILAASFNLSYDKQEGKYIISGKGCK